MKPYLPEWVKETLAIAALFAVVLVVTESCNGGGSEYDRDDNYRARGIRD